MWPASGTLWSQSENWTILSRDSLKVTRRNVTVGTKQTTFLWGMVEEVETNWLLFCVCVCSITNTNDSGQNTDIYLLKHIFSWLDPSSTGFWLNDLCPMTNANVGKTQTTSLWGLVGKWLVLEMRGWDFSESTSFSENAANVCDKVISKNMSLLAGEWGLNISET